MFQQTGSDVSKDILIIEDDETLASFYAGVLQSAGMQTCVVTEPRQVMAPLADFQPDLITCDIHMPQCNGIELATLIRQQPEFVRVPIIFLSAETSLDQQAQALRQGGDDFITKPVSPETLVSAAQSRARRHRSLLAAEDTLRISEERFRLVVETSLDGFLQSLPDGMVVAANQAACTMFGMSEQQIRAGGIAGLVCCLVMGRRRGYGREAFTPFNLGLTMAGAGMLWVGWFGFNAGSALVAGELSTLAFFTTHVATATAALSWMVAEWKIQGKPTTLGAASGALAGLVAITPAAGFVGPLPAMFIGLVAGTLCYLAVLAKGKFGYDDALDVVGVHGVGGIWGALATGLFASTVWNPAGKNGLFFGNPGQLGVQAIGVVAAVAYSMLITYIILKVIDAMVGLRVTEDEERQGLDLTQHSETGYSM